MKLRHVRAVAVFVGVVVALTGAKHSSGGGCSGDNSSSSSSTSGGTTSGGSHYDDDDDYDSSGSGSGGVEVSESPAGEETDDVVIESCRLDGTKAVARVRASNLSSVTDYSYTFTVGFRAPDGTTFHTGDYTIQNVPAGSSDTLSMAATPPSGRFEADGDDCDLTNVRKISVS